MALHNLMFIPKETRCGGYNVFDPSFSQSVSPFFLVNSAPLKPLNRNSLNFVVKKDILKDIIFAGNSDTLFSWELHVYAPFEPRNLTKIKYTTETVC